MFIVWTDYGSYEGWKRTDAESWDDAVAAWRDALRMGYDAIVTEYIPLTVHDGRLSGLRPHERIRALRTRRGLTQSELGHLLNPPRTHAAVSDIERGKTRMTVDLAEQFANVLQVRRDDILVEQPAKAS